MAALLGGGFLARIIPDGVKALVGRTRAKKGERAAYAEKAQELVAIAVKTLEAGPAGTSGSSASFCLSSDTPLLRR